MKTSVSRTEIVEWLDGYLDVWPVDHVEFALAETAGASLDGARLLLVRRGHRCLRSSPTGAGFEVMPHTPLLAAPERRLALTEGLDFEGMTIRYGKEALRFLGMDLEMGQEPWRAVHCVGLPLDELGHRQLEILMRGGRRPPPAKAVVPMLQALLFLTRESLRGSMPGVGGKAQRTWLAVREFLEEHCNAPINREIVAQAFDVCPSYLSKLVARQTGESFNGFLTRLRMERAAWLLQNPELSVQRTATLCGFKHVAYFIRVFREYFGRTPRKFRTQLA